MKIYDSPNSPSPTKKTRLSSSDEHCLLGFVPFKFIQFCLAQGAAGGLTVAVANARLALKKVAEFQVSSCDEEMGVPTGGQRCPTNIIESKAPRIVKESTFEECGHTMIFRRSTSLF